VAVVVLLAPLFASVRRKRKDDNVLRNKIYATIVSKPGIHYNGIKYWLELSNGTLAHHLVILEREGMIKAKRDGLFKRYFPAEKETEVIAPEFMSMEDKISILVRDNPGSSQTELAYLLDESKQKVHYNVRKMEDKGLIYLEKDMAGHTSIYLADGKLAARKKEKIFRKEVTPPEEEERGRPTKAVRKKAKPKVKVIRKETVADKKVNGEVEKKVNGKKAGKIAGEKPEKKVVGNGIKGKRDLGPAPTTAKRLPSGKKSGVKKGKAKEMAGKKTVAGARRKVIRVSAEDLKPEESNVVDADFSDVGGMADAEPDLDLENGNGNGLE
jgi:hypothetical protein